MANYEQQVKEKFEWFDNILDARQKGYKSIILLAPDYTVAKKMLNEFESVKNVTVHRARRIVLFEDIEVRVLQEDNLEAALGYDRHVTAIVKWRRYA